VRFLERLGLRRRSTTRRELQIDFLGEQDGPVERTLKTGLATEFARLPQIRSAYLTRLRYANGDHAVALALDAAAGTKPEAVVRRVHDCFARIFASSQYLDILFLDDLQRAAVARSSEPFYRERSGTSVTD
jgi:hypothetical protein